MELVTVTILPKHLKGNSWSHMTSYANRRCPLEEALNDMGLKNYTSASFVLFENENDENAKQYIPEHIWNRHEARDLIEAANNGSEKSLTFTLLRERQESGFSRHL